MIKAVLFDFDGVIVNSEYFHFFVEKKVIKKCGFILKKVVFDKTLGLCMKDTFLFYIKYFGVKQTWEKLLKEHDRIFFKTLDKKLILMPSAKRVIKLLVNHKYICAIVSSGRLRYIKKALEKFHLLKIFKNKIITIEMVKKGKPNPDLFIYAAARLRVSNKECLIIEDSINGIKAAKKAGIKSLFLNKNFLLNELQFKTLRIKSLADINLKLIQSI